MHTRREDQERRKNITNTKKKEAGDIDLVVCTRDLRSLCGRKGLAWVARDRAQREWCVRTQERRVQRAISSSSLPPEPLVPALWRLAVRKGPTTPAATAARGIITIPGLVVLLVVLDEDGGRAVPTVDGGLGSTVPGGSPRDEEVVVVDVAGRETGGLLLAWERAYGDGSGSGGAAEAAAEPAAAAGMGEVGGRGGLRRAPVEV